MNHLTQTQSKFESMMQIAEILSFNELLPECLRGTRDRQTKKLTPYSEVQRRAICFSILREADMLGLDPFLLAKMAYSIKGKLDYEGRAYAAVANIRAGLKGNLQYEHTGSGSDRAVVCIGWLEGEDAPRRMPYTLKEGRASGDADAWDKDPEQRLKYASARKWVKAYCPEVMLGHDATDAPSEPVTQPGHLDEKRWHEAARIAEVPAQETVRPLTDYAAAIEVAENRGELETIAADINDDENLSNDEKRLFLQMGRDAYGKFNKPEQAAVARWERTIKTEVDRGRLLEMRGEIGADGALQDDEATYLGTIVQDCLDRMDSAEGVTTP